MLSAQAHFSFTQCTLCNSISKVECCNEYEDGTTNADDPIAFNYKFTHRIYKAVNTSFQTNGQ